MYATALIALNPATAAAMSSNPALRRACAEDAPALGAFLQGLSARSRRLRFHGACAASPSMAQRLCAVDGVGHQAWLAWVGCGEGAVVIGEARFVVSADGRSAELAIAVDDAWHGQGLADALMRNLLEAAAAVGVSELYGEVLGDNPRMQAFMRRHGFGAEAHTHGDELRMTRDLSDTAASQSTGGLLTWLRVALGGGWAVPGLRPRLSQA